jgi:hypothetical protein
MVFAGVLAPGCIPQVIACGGFAVPRVRSGFGSETGSAYSHSTATDTVFSPKSVVYKVFGPVGAAAGVGYFDRPPTRTGPMGRTTLVFADHGECFGRHG